MFNTNKYEKIEAMIMFLTGMIAAVLFFHII